MVRKLTKVASKHLTRRKRFFMTTLIKIFIITASLFLLYWFTLRISLIHSHCNDAAKIKTFYNAYTHEYTKCLHSNGL